jgi:hypothetical protein
MLALGLAVIPSRGAYALITGGEGNSPVHDPGWPKGAEPLFNDKARIAWWEGPPLGGGNWHAEFRGDAKALTAFLDGFAKLESKNKRIVLHDGVGQSFWLNPNRKEDKQKDARLDWTFEVWQQTNWEHLRKLPADLNPTDPGDANDGPPSQIDVYTGGNVHWSDVTVPKDLKVVDQRLEAHGFTVEDKTVLEGTIVDLATKQPLAARIVLQRIEPQQKGGYHYTDVAKANADAQGKWVLKNAPIGWFQVVAQADGYVPRILGYGQFDGQPSWHTYSSGLARPAPVNGRVTDDAGQPIQDVEVRIQDVTAADGSRYESPNGYTVKTDADGRFHTDQVPVGKGTVWIHKPGYCRPGLGPPIVMADIGSVKPTANVELKMTRSSQVQVTVDFSKTKRPQGYIVEITPEGGNKVGSWGGSGNINNKNQMAFNDVPPGRYTIHGQPNPGSANERTEPVTVDLKGGETKEITLMAK